jgi:hypothetical protein
MQVWVWEKCFSHIDFQLLLQGCMILSGALTTAGHYSTIYVHTGHLHSYFRIDVYFMLIYYVALFLPLELLMRDRN